MKNNFRGRNNFDESQVVSSIFVQNIISNDKSLH